MCNFCQIENKLVLDSDFFSELEIRTFIDSVFLGIITTDNLDVNLYLKMSRKMSDSIEVGYGQNLSYFQFGSEDYMLLSDLIDSGYIFNAAKQYQLVREINDLINEDFSSKEDYYINATNIFKKYNIDYFETELDSAEWQAKSAKKWVELTKWNNG